jgi:hypothetical protein
MPFNELSDQQSHMYNFVFTLIPCSAIYFLHSFGEVH